MKNTIKWAIAIVFSLLAHAAATTLFEAKPDEVEIAGGEAMEVTLLGNAFEETIQAGDSTQPLDPLEVPPEEVQPEETAEAEPVVEEVAPVESEVAPETPSDVTPVEADVILPAEEMPPVTSEDPEFSATVAPVETVIPEEKPEIKPEPEPEKVVEKPVEKPAPKKKPTKEKVEKKIVKKRAGEDGEAQSSQTKGQADGAENAAASTSKGKKGAFSRQSGNAAVSNYPGKVRSKLSRSFRYPSAAKREGLKGLALVRFTVSSSGAVSGVKIVRSGGSPIVDQAALDAVQRAAPFPKIPEEAGRTNWAFTIPLGIE